MAELIILYSQHRPEVINEMARYLRNCDLLITEDAPSKLFQDMLSRTATIEDYLQSTEIEYPEFGRRLCRLWRHLHDTGIPVVQVEPFVETLLDIHNFFADGGKGHNIPVDSLRYQVYLAEKEATAALLNFYQSASGGNFQTIVKATRRFAMFDARRFALRDQLRAHAIVELCTNYKRVCIEAGQMHQALGRYLRSNLPAGHQIKPVFLIRRALGMLKHKCHLFSPGDLLTLHEIFHPGRSRERHNLLAARALIYNKIVIKEEMLPGETRYPHALDEVQCITRVNRLSYDECRELFEPMRHSSTRQARSVLLDHLNRSGRGAG